MSNGWQLIETAPLDGSEVDLWVVGGKYKNGDQWRAVGCRYVKGQWWIDDCPLDNYFFAAVVTPTHWMLPPKAPT